jgi:hypothetical protein
LIRAIGPRLCRPGRSLSDNDPIITEPSNINEEFAAMNKERGSDRPGGPAGESGVRVRWDDANMRSLYSNVCNVTGTREEIVLLFGVHQNWNSAAKELVIQLLERIVLNPYAAKRLQLLLGRVLKEYESRYGALPIEAGEQPRPAEPLPTGG